jgi:hypothetical protein
MARDWGLLRRLLCLVVPLWLGGCGEPTANGPISLSVVSGGGQEGLPGEELAEPIVVRVTDGDGPVEGVLINFVVVQGGGQVFAGAALTNSQGEARERWTLGAEGENVVEARGVDQATGEAIVYARITAHAVDPNQGAVATLTVYPEVPQLRLLDSLVDVTLYVRARDAQGNWIPNAPLTLSAPAPLRVMGNLVTADRETAAWVAISSGPAAASLETHFIVDLPRIRWRLSYRCYEGFTLTPVADVDSTVTVVVSDSVRYERQPVDSLGPTTRLYLWSTGTTTMFYSDGRVTTFDSHGRVITNTIQPVPNERIVFIQAVGKVQYYPNDGSSGPMTEGISDGALPPTYTGGNLCPGQYDRFSPVVLEPAP